ncbi:MAG: sulfatase-like hydrolase/transferase [bacterium]|nr:sulfatase-like hydrolase/transferase [bacterium]
MILAILTVLGCSDLGPSPAPHVLVITLDTARADRFSYAGDSPVATPNVDALAAEGTAFLQAVTPAPITLAAHASLLTGQLPTHHGVRNNGTYRLAAEAVTLGELLRDRGYRTAAFVGSSVLDHQYGLDQGFDHYDDLMPSRDQGPGFYPERPGGAVVEAALSRLAQHDRTPTFTWVHLFDPHIPYAPPEPERSQYAASLYDGEIAYSDRVVGTLLDGYRRLDLLDDTIVVFTSDHGESLGAHGELTHGAFLFDATVRVPLVIRVPGLDQVGRVESQVHLADILPTVAEILGLSIPEDIQGTSLVPLMRGLAETPGTEAPRTAYLETFLPLENYGWFRLWGVRTEDWKLVSGTYPELFDLQADPEELADVAAGHPELTRDLSRVLQRDFPDRAAGAGQRFDPGEATRRQLSALGYLSQPLAVADLAEDPVERYLERRRKTVKELFERGLVSEARDRAAELVGEDARLPEPPPRGPEQSPGALLAAAEAAAGSDDMVTVRASLTELAGILHRTEAEPEPRALQTAAALSRIGNACWVRTRYGEAAHAFMLGIRLVPDDPRFYYNAGLAWERLGDMGEALWAYDATLARDPDFPRARQHRDYADAVVRHILPRP